MHRLHGSLDTWGVRAGLGKQGSGLAHTRSGGVMGLLESLKSGLGLVRHGSGAKQACPSAGLCILGGGSDAGDRGAQGEPAANARHCIALQGSQRAGTCL